MNVHGLRGRALRGAVLSMMLVVPPLAQRGPSSPNAGTSQAFVDPKGETTVVSTENQSGSRSPSISADGLFAAWVETYPRGGGPVRLTSARNAASGATAPAAINDGLGELSRLREANLDTGTTAIVMPPNALGVVGDPMLAANVVVASVDLNHPRPPPDVIETCTGNCGPPRLAPPPVVLPTVFRHVNGSTGWQQFGVGTQPAISGNAERVAFVEPSHVRKSYQEGFYAVIQPPSLPLLPPPDPFPVAVPNCSVQWPFATSCHYVKRAIQKDFVSGHVVVASSDGTRVADLLATVTTYRATNTNDPIWVAPAGLPPDADLPPADSIEPVLDQTGHTVVITAPTGKYVGGDGNGLPDVVLADLTTSPPTFQTVSADSSGNAANGSSSRPSMSTDGRLISFVSSASNLSSAERASNDSDIFVFDRDPDRANGMWPAAFQPHAIREVDVNFTIGSVPFVSVRGTPRLSRDGTQIAYTSRNTLAIGGAPRYEQARVVNVDATDPADPLRLFGTDVISVGADGGNGEGDSGAPALSDGGRRVLFASNAPNITGATPPGTGLAKQEIMMRSRPAELSTPQTIITIPPTKIGASFRVTIPVANAGPAVSYGSIIAKQGSRSAEFPVTSETCTHQPIFQGSPPPSGCEIVVDFKPVQSGDAEVTLILISSSGDLSVKVVASSGVGVLEFAPDPITFDVQRTGTTSDPARLTMTNVGTFDTVMGPVSVEPAPGSDPSDAKAFTVVPDSLSCAATPIPVGGSCTVDITFSPTTDRRYSADLMVRSDADPIVARVSLQGPGNRAVLRADPDALDFGVQKKDTRSAGRTVTVTNLGGDPSANLPPIDATISQLRVVADGSPTSGPPVQGVTPAFVITHDGCTGVTLDPQTSCTFDIAFEPSLLARFDGRVDIVSNGSNVPNTRLSGLGALGTLAVTPSSLDAGIHRADAPAIPVGPVVATNTGPVDLVISSVQLMGADPGNWSLEAGRCTVVLAPGRSCSLPLALTPRLGGTSAAITRFASDGTNPSVDVTLAAVVRPVLAVQPRAGQPTDVPVLLGLGFPVGSAVSLRWLNHPGAATATADGSGAFRTPLIVLDEDGLGERQVEATGPGYEPVFLDHPYLLGPGSGQPPDLVWRR